MPDGKFEFNIRERVPQHKDMTDLQLGGRIATVYHSIDFMTWATRGMPFQRLFGPMEKLIDKIIDNLQGGPHSHASDDVKAKLAAAWPHLLEIQRLADTLPSTDRFPVDELWTEIVDEHEQPLRWAILQEWISVNDELAPYVCLPFVDVQTGTPPKLVSKQDMRDYRRYFNTYGLDDLYRKHGKYDDDKFKTNLGDGVKNGILVRSRLAGASAAAPFQVVSSLGNNGGNDLKCGGGGTCVEQNNSFCSIADGDVSCSAASG